eukprot:8747980-Pyramimonas_sp.AAC.1
MAARGCRVPWVCLRPPKNDSRMPTSIVFVKASTTMAQVGIQLSLSALLGSTASLIMEATMRNRLSVDWPASEAMCVTRPLLSL